MTIGTANYSMLEHDPAMRRLAGAIYERCGIDYKDSLYSLAAKAGTRVKALGMSICQYLEYLEQHPAEWDALIEKVTINETYFFREESQLEELTQVVLPALVQEGRDEIRIWSAACSTGEEPYSLAMTILESGLVPLSKIHIYATDINKRVLKLAEQGFYSGQSMCFRRTPAHIREKYFDAVQDGYLIKEQIRRRVRFLPWNLLHPAAGVLPMMDIIFCRNVLIYFDEVTIRTVIGHLSDRLVQGGYLFLGHAETISGLMPELRTVTTSSTFYYRKESVQV